MWTQRIFKLFIFLLAFFYLYNLISLIVNKEKFIESDFSALRTEIQRLEKLAVDGSQDIARLRDAIAKETARYKRMEEDQRSERYRNRIRILREWTDPIPVIVFACNRVTAIKNHIEKLIKYRTSEEKFPIIVSQDCDDSQVADAIRSYGSAVQYIKHVSGEKAEIIVSPGQQRYITYYRIARHYKLGLSYVFDKLNYTSVIITEDDLDIAPDFFSYFSATRHLMQVDRSIYCVSAWNDNGKENLVDMSAVKTLYRSDFFPGLGWMMTSDLWHEFGPIWPDGFWDDWIRDPLRRKNRTCIRPEISRTGMTSEGRKGASKGLFFSKHLAKIKVNTEPVDFTKHNVLYLLKNNYDNVFLGRVESAKLVNLPALSHQILNFKGNGSEYRIEYSSLHEYLTIADKLQIMRDFKAGVPRTAYLGIVTCFINSNRIFVTPNRTVWKHYDPSWEAPENPADMNLS